MNDIMTEVRKRLFELQDEKYAEFQRKLIPTVEKESVIGVRIPELRKFAKGLIKEGKEEAFLKELPHTYYDENVLHGLILSERKDVEVCVREVEAFLPYVDNWAVCDTMSPKVFKKHKSELFSKFKEWAASDKTYTCRFGIGMLMSHFLDEEFTPEVLQIAAAPDSEEYYVKMMVAWFFATALAKQWESTISYIEEKKLAPWVHNKTIQKAVESYRITEEQKKVLKVLKVAQAE